VADVKKTIVALLCFVILYACTNTASSIGGSNTDRKSKKKTGDYHEFIKDCLFLSSGHSNSVGINDEFIVELSVTPSSGYLWYYKISSAESLTLIQERVFNDNAPDVIGGTQKHVWKFKAMAPDKVNINFKKYRKWIGEKSAIEESNFTIYIDKKQGEI
jgi:predicted secreted protein